MELTIGIDGRTFAVPEPGGTVRTGLKLAEGLLTSDLEVKIFGHTDIKNTFPAEDVYPSGLFTQFRPFGMFWEQTALPIGGSCEDIDVLYSPESYCPLSPTPFPCVITIHDLSSFHGYSAGWYNTFQQVVTPLMAKRADKIITVSKYSKKDIADQLSVSKEKIEVVYNGVDDVFLSDDSPIPELDLPNKYLLYVGSMSTRKNLTGLLEGYSILRNKYGLDHKLVLIGPEDDPTNKQILPTIDNAVPENAIVNPGYVSDAELKYAYQNADAFVFPSLFEGFGIPPLEAMACRTPVVASNRTAIPEILGDAAHYINPEKPSDIADGVVSILNDSEYQQTLIDQGLERVSEFTWEQASDDLHKMLRDVGDSV